jgi:hypothetical protein
MAAFCAFTLFLLFASCSFLFNFFYSLFASSRGSCFSFLTAQSKRILYHSDQIKSEIENPSTSHCLRISFLSSSSFVNLICQFTPALTSTGDCLMKIYFDFEGKVKVAIRAWKLINYHLSMQKHTPRLGYCALHKLSTVHAHFHSGLITSFELEIAN